METLISELPEIITSLGVIILGFFTYNQYTRNKRTDYELEKLKLSDKVKNKRRADASSKIWGAVHNILTQTGADRVYIVQPHPLGNEEMLSIYYEVVRNGVEEMKPFIQKMKINRVAKFAEYLSEHLFVYITDIDKQVDDRYARSLMSTHGTSHLIVKRLSSAENDWVGSIFCEYTKEITLPEPSAKTILHRAATNIQYILPPIE